MTAEAIHIPNISPFEALTIDVSDLLLEARNWCDGEAATTQAQVDEIARLKDELADRAKLLEAERVAEKKPLDEKISAIQDRFNVWLAPLKNKTPGKIPMALDALDAAKRPFLLAREAEIRAAADKARAEAEAKAREAAEAARLASASDLQAREDAEAIFADAEAAARAAKAAEAEKAHAHGSGRAQGLRTRIIAEVTDPAAAIRYYYGTEPEAFTALVQQLADRDARANRKLATGVTFRDERY